MPVHLYGQPASWDAIADIAGRHDLPLLEDAAQAHGAQWRGRPAGSLGIAAGFSFYPGPEPRRASATPRRGDDRRRPVGSRDPNAAQLRCGSADPPRCVGRQLAPRRAFQAAMLSVKLARLRAENQRRCETAARYLDGLRDATVRLPVVTPGADPVWHLFVIRHSKRDQLAEELGRRGVETLIHYPVAPHRSGAYRDLPVDPDQVRVAEHLAAEVLSLPMGPHISDDQADATSLPAVQDAAAGGRTVSASRRRTAAPRCRDTARRRSCTRRAAHPTSSLRSVRWRAA